MPDISLDGVGLDRLEIFVEGLDHPEGVTTGPNGDVYAGGEAGQVYRVDVTNRTLEQVGSTGGFLLGVTLDAAGRVYACDTKNLAVMRLDPGGGEATAWSTGTAARPMVNPNMLVFAADGFAYVTDSGHFDAADGCIFRVAPDGRTDVWCDTSRNFPNGACLDVEGTGLYVAESTGVPALVHIEISGDGRAGRRRIVAELPGTVPDGVALDAEGNAYVTCYRPDRVVRVSPGGRLEVLAEDPRGTIIAATTNATFAGPDLRTCVIANLGRWHLTSADFGIPGLALRYPDLGSA
ncbi:MAG: SMP-30/gluconolactonase/LRE family protein [Candidatus Dormibacteria bacterium]